MLPGYGAETPITGWLGQLAKKTGPKHLQITRHAQQNRMMLRNLTSNLLII